MHQQNVKMSQKKFRIGELAKKLEVKKFVIRFWEKEFELKSDRSNGGQRFYSLDDFKTFNTIKQLLYKQGYTISGAKTQLETITKNKKYIMQNNTEKTDTKQSKPDQIKAATKIIEKRIRYIPKEFLEQVYTLKEKLLKLKESLN